MPVPMVYIMQDFEYAIGFPKALNGFRPVDQEYLPGAKVQVRNRVFAPTLEAAFDVEGVDAVVIGCPADTKKAPGEWVLVTVHEMFHVYQTARGSDAKVASLKLGPTTDASWQLNYAFPYQDSDVMRLVQLQGYLTYLGFTDSEDVAMKITAGNVMDAVKVYQGLLKREYATGQSYNYSRFQEWVEGIALYTEYKMAEAAAGGDYHPTADFAQLPDFQSYQRVWEEKYKNKVFLVKFAGRIARSRSVFYPLGFGKGLLLDRLMPDWKSKYFTADIWLDDLLLAATNNPN